MGSFSLRLNETDRWQEYSLFVISIATISPSLSFALYFQLHYFFPMGFLAMHSSSWLDHESPKIGSNFPKSLSSLSGD